MTTTELRIHRHEFPKLSLRYDAANGLLDRFDTYAELSCGDIKAEVVRFSFWDVRDDVPDESTFEVQLVGLPETARARARCTPTTRKPWSALSEAVTANAAWLLDEARRR
jgi:hypothetical protein